MIEKPAAVRSFSMVIGGECRMGRGGALRGLMLEPKLYSGEKHNQISKPCLANQKIGKPPAR